MRRFGVSSLEAWCLSVVERDTAICGKILWARWVGIIISSNPLPLLLLSYWRSVVPEMQIIESRPEFPMENLRIVQPFPELESFFLKVHFFCSISVDSFQFDTSGTMSKKEQLHIPAFVLLYHALRLFSPEKVAPRTSEVLFDFSQKSSSQISGTRVQEKKRFKAILESFATQPSQENVEEAVAMATKYV